MKKKLRTLALCGLAGILFAGAAHADVKAGVDAWSRGNFEAAVKEWKPLADKGDADAQFNLAQAYKLGRGVPLDIAKAEQLYGKAAALGHVQAADSYGLLLFQRGERERALPYIKASSARGDARAQYILGVAHFNGDIVAKEWVRASALVSLAQQAGLPQATNALTQMNAHIPLAQRQQSVPLAAQIAAETQATRQRLATAADLGVREPKSAATAPPPATQFALAESGLSDAAAPARTQRPSETKVSVAPSTVTVAARTVAQDPTGTPSGPWRVQLGAFGVPGNADALWKKLRARPELSGRAKLIVPAGKLVKLQAGGFASKAEADAACKRLSAGGVACLPVHQ